MWSRTILRRSVTFVKPCLSVRQRFIGQEIEAIVRPPTTTNELGVHCRGRVTFLGFVRVFIYSIREFCFDFTKMVGISLSFLCKKIQFLTKLIIE